MTVFYPDIASFQAGISMKGALAVCTKVTEGTGYLNPDYARAKRNAAANGCYFFAYHFLHHGSAVAQAQWAFKNAGTTPLMLDVEPTPVTRPTVSDVVAFVVAYRALGGVCHLIYLPHWYWQELGSPRLTPLQNLGIAIVASDYEAYTNQSNIRGWAAYGGVVPMIWQYTDHMSFNGYVCDFNAFRGSHGGEQTAVGMKDCLRELKEVTRTGDYTINPLPVDLRVTVPVTIGMKANDAVDKLEKESLVVTVQPSRDPAFEYVSNGTVPVGGTKVNKRSAIQLNVKLKTAVVPKTFGMKANDAIAVLATAGFSNIVTKPIRDPDNEYESIGTSPVGGTEVPTGAQVTLNVKVVRKG